MVSIHQRLQLETKLEACGVLSEAEKVVFTQVNNIWAYNGFFNDGGDFVVFGASSRMPHSCAANCYNTIEGDIFTCRLVQPVKRGEELTISYNRMYDDKPTFERIRYYMMSKELVCDCPRCSALGDDTRMFNCFDARNCKGRHFTCQRSEFDVPYLLPCDVCKKTPPQDWQAKMFALETRGESSGQINKAAEAMGVSVSERERLKMWKSVMPTGYYPSYHHGCCAEINKTKAHCMLASYPHASLDDTVEAVRAVFRPFDHMMRFPNMVEYMTVAGYLSCLAVNDQGMRLAAYYAKRAIRTRLIVFGRDDIGRQKHVDDNLAFFLSNLPPQKNTVKQCMFCDERPDRAAFTLL